MIHLEFHARQESPTRSATIHFALIRLQTLDGLWTYPDGLPSLAEYYAKLPSLRTVVVEMGPQLVEADVQLLVSALCEETTAQVRVRACREAHELALQAKRHPDAGFLRDTGRVSPFWYMREYSDTWNDW